MRPTLIDRLMIKKEGVIDLKKIKYVIMISGVVILFIVTMLVSTNLRKNNENKTNKEIIQVSKDNEALKDVKKTGVETIEEDGYTIILRGSARPENSEISVKKAAKIGLRAVKKKYKINTKDCKIEMIFLDGISTITGTWDGHINLSNTEKYEFIIDGKKSKVDYLLKIE